LYVLLDTKPTDDLGSTHDGTNNRTSELIATLQEQLAEEREARRRADTIIAQLARTTEEQARTIRELEAPPDTPTDQPSDARQSDDTAEAGGADTTAPGDPQTTTSQRPWWRRILGG